jgi:putative acyl-CoA dehydrogenase
MGMTERQGGSDVRANTTLAEPVSGGGPGNEYFITGHKWFCSAPMCDAFFILAQAPAGLSCFLLPRWRSDGTRNAFHLLRLKDKLGNRSNASSEVEFLRASARLIGEEGRGVAAIMEMVRHTRLDCVLGSAASMRKAVAEATNHAAHRSVFGRLLIDQPLMRNVLAELCLESEAATTLAIRLAHAFDCSGEDAREQKFARIATAIAKYWITKRAPAVVAEALECLGGNGYVEESPLPRLYRDAPLNSLWEGAGNVQCLDVLRLMQKDPSTVEALHQEVTSATGVNSIFDRFVGSLLSKKQMGTDAEFGARWLVEKTALALEAAALIRSGNQGIADLFCAARLTENLGLGFGTLRSKQRRCLTARARTTEADNKMTNDTSRGDRFLDPGEIAEGKFDLDVFGNRRYQMAAARSGNSIPKDPNLYRRGCMPALRLKLCANFMVPGAIAIHYETFG